MENTSGVNIQFQKWLFWGEKEGFDGMSSLDVSKDSTSYTYNNCLETLTTNDKIILDLKCKKKLLSVIKTNDKMLDFTAKNIKLNSLQFYTTEPILKRDRVNTKVKKEINLYIKSLNEFKSGFVTDGNESQNVFIKEKTRLSKETISLSNAEKNILKSAIEKNMLNFQPEIMEMHVDNEGQFYMEDWIPAQVIIKKTPIHINFNSWKMPSFYDPTKVLDENSSKLPLIELSSSALKSIEEKEIFQDPFLVFDPILPLVTRTHIKPKLTNWKNLFEGRILWNLTDDQKDSLLNESISEVELKFKVETPVLPPITKSKCYLKFEDQWIYSKFKTYMMDWKPFSKLNPQIVLKEQLIFELPRLSMDKNIFKIRKITMIEMEQEQETDFFKDTSLIEEVIDVNNSLSDLEIDKSIEPPFGQYQKEIVKVKHEGILVEDDFPTPTKLKSPLHIAHEKSFSNILPTSGIIPSRSISKSRCTSSKRSQPSSRPRSSLDMIIAKRRKTNSKLSKVTAYPNLDQLNCTTTNGQITPPPPLPSSLPISSMEPPSEPPITPYSVQHHLQQVLVPLQSEFSNILGDGSTELTNIGLSRSKSESIVICLNSNFPNKFGAVYLKFENIIGKIGIDVIEMIIPAEAANVIEIDMFLNKSCGVLIMSLIEIQQVNLQTNELIIIEQLGTIGNQVTSLIIVVLIDNFLMNDNIREILKELVNFGIQIIEIGDQVNEIVKCLMQLIQKYARHPVMINWDDYRFERFSQIGVQNPLFIQWIISNMEMLMNLQENDLEKKLMDFCSKELAEVISIEIFRS